MKGCNLPRQRFAGHLLVTLCAAPLMLACTYDFDQFIVEQGASPTAENAAGQGGRTNAVSSPGGAATQAGTLSVAGSSSSGGASNVAGTPSSGGALSIAGRLSIGGTSSIAGRLSIGGTSSISGASSIAGRPSIGGTSSISGASSIAGRPSIGGGSSIGGTASAGGGCAIASFQAPELVGGLGMDSYDQWGPSLSADGLTLYFAASSSVELDNIFVATRSIRSAAFSPAISLDSVNTTSADGSPSISNDGLTLYFYSMRPGGLGGRDIWRAKRSSIAADFANVQLVGGVNGPSDDHLPWISRDELTLMFSSMRSGGGDLLIATRANTSADFSVRVGVSGVNSDTAREDRGVLSNDGKTIYFVSDRSNGLGDKDIWYATRPDTQSGFSNVTNLQTANSPQRDIDVFLSADERELFFVSKRNGRSQIFRSSRTCP